MINIASVHTLAGMPVAAPYDAAKWDLVGMTKALAVEYAARNIRFNCISPGLIDTQIWQDIVSAADDPQQCQAHWWANIPAGRVGRRCRRLRLRPGGEVQIGIGAPLPQDRRPFLVAPSLTSSPGAYIQ